MDGEELFQRGMMALGALGVALIAAVMCVGMSGLDYWALGIDVVEEPQDEPIADANGVIYVPVDQDPPRTKVRADQATVRCESDAFGPDTLSLPFDPTRTVDVSVLGRSITALVPPDVPGEVEIRSDAGSVVISWPAVPAGTVGACVATAKQAPAAP